MISNRNFKEDKKREVLDRLKNDRKKTNTKIQHNSPVTISQEVNNTSSLKVERHQIQKIEKNERHQIQKIEKNETKQNETKQNEKKQNERHTMIKIIEPKKKMIQQEQQVNYINHPFSTFNTKSFQYNFIKNRVDKVDQVEDIMRIDINKPIIVPVEVKEMPKPIKLNMKMSYNHDYLNEIRKNEKLQNDKIQNDKIQINKIIKENQVILLWKNDEIESLETFNVQETKKLQEECGCRVLCHFLKKELIFVKRENEEPKYFIEIKDKPFPIFTPYAIYKYLQNTGNTTTIDEIIQKWEQPLLPDNNNDTVMQLENIIETNLPYYLQDSLCLILRGHIRDSFNDNNLYYLIKGTMQLYPFMKIYIHTWNKKSSNKSWRTVLQDNTIITEKMIRNYFKDTAKCIQTILIDNDERIEIVGNKNGIICKTKQPVIAWKNMWYGIERIMQEVVKDESNNKRIVINTRFDIMNNSHNKSATDFYQFVKKNIESPKMKRNQFHYVNNDYYGIDNLQAGDVKTMQILIHHFYSNMDEILKMYPNIFVQEVIVFYENNRIFGGLPIHEIYVNIKLYERI
jgi:hypothetical protein